MPLATPTVRRLYEIARRPDKDLCPRSRKLSRQEKAFVKARQQDASDYLDLLKRSEGDLVSAFIPARGSDKPSVLAFTVRIVCDWKLLSRH